MSFTHFLRVERDDRAGSRHYVVHTVDPRFSMELAPDWGSPDQVGQGVIKRICLPNSWAGDYSQCARLISSAQDFFAQTISVPAAKPATRRFVR
ncbi:MAG: hypothetical protein ACHQ4G_00700 [Opitutales bacterium]